MNKTSNTLLLASQSFSRRMLLDSVHIPYRTIAQTADESLHGKGLPIEKKVLAIARAKMAHALLPTATHESQIIYVLTADTMTEDVYGMIHGKPKDRQDAIAKIKMARLGSHLATGFCIDKKIWYQDQWQVDAHIHSVVSAHYIVDIPDDCINDYLDSTYAMQCAGAIAIEGIGGQFLKTVNGSYSTIIGLPLFQVRHALHTLGFFNG